MEAKQWWVEAQPGLNNLAVVEGPQGPEIKKPVCKVHGGPEMWDTASLIAAAPTMHKKLTDTVDWLDREIEDLRDCSPDYFRAAQIEHLEELRDDLAETLRKIGEGI